MLSIHLHIVRVADAAQIADVFEKLMMLRRAVVLFDEIEEFCLDRSAAGGMESRMLTTAMLTKFADLRRRRDVCFFIATNRLTALDSAVTRPGRFDLQLFVGTPNLSARLGRFRARLAAARTALGTRADSETAAEAETAFERVLMRRWHADAKYMNYLECEKLAADAVACWVAQGAAGTQLQLEEAFEALLNAQVAVMTVRGSVREEFDRCLALSRT